MHKINGVNVYALYATQALEIYYVAEIHIHVTFKKLPQHHFRVFFIFLSRVHFYEILKNCLLNRGSYTGGHFI